MPVRVSNACPLTAQTLPFNAGYGISRRQLSIQATSLTSVAEGRYDRFWHFSGVLACHNYVRFRMHCRRDVLIASLSANDRDRIAASREFAERRISNVEPRRYWTGAQAVRRLSQEVGFV